MGSISSGFFQSSFFRQVQIDKAKIFKLLAFTKKEMSSSILILLKKIELDLVL